MYLHSENLLQQCRLDVKAFTRSRLLPFVVLVTYIINLIRRSLQFEISSFASFIGFPDASKQAFSQARKKLSPLVFQLLNKQLLIEFYSNNEVKLFKGFRVLAVDGSTLRLPKSDELYACFGSHTAQGSVPMALTSFAYDVLNNMTLHATLKPYYGAPTNNDDSEKTMALEHFKAIKLLDAELSNANFQDLYTFDRGYPSRYFMLLLREMNKHFLFRAPKTGNISEVQKAIDEGHSDIIIDLEINKHMFRDQAEKDFFLRLADKSLKIRVVVFKLKNGTKEVLLTSLLDQAKFTYNDLFELYGMRWNVEENYKFYKCIAEIENFSGESKLAIEQDFHATVFTCNAASLLAQEAQAEVEAAAEDKTKNEGKVTKYAYKINRNILIGTIKNEILEVLLGDQDLTRYCERLKRRLKRSLIAVRPGRSFERLTSRRERRPIIHKNAM